MNKLDIILKDEDIENEIKKSAYIPIKAFYNPVNWESNIHFIYEDDNREITDVIQWFLELAELHNASIIYYDLKVFERKNYLINKDDIFSFIIENNLEISDEVIEQFMQMIDDFNEKIRSKKEGVVDTYILYFLHEGKIFSYFMKNQDLVSIDDFLDDIIEEIEVDLNNGPSRFIN